MKPIYGKIKKEEKKPGIPIFNIFGVTVVAMMLGLILRAWGSLI